MLTLSSDPRTADQQMRAILFYLTTFGHIDGEFDVSEKKFVRDYIEKLVTHRVQSASNLDASARPALVKKYTAHFHEVFEKVDEEVKELFSEAVSHDEDQNNFVHAKLKLRCFEIFKSFDVRAQEQLMETIDHLLLSDGEAHPAEVKFRAELSELLEDDLDLTLEDEGPRASLTVTPAQELPCLGDAPQFFAEIEHHYSSDPATIKRQIAVDMEIMGRVVDELEKQRAAGKGKLSGKRSVLDLTGPAFLDGHVAVCPAQPGRSYDVTVLGDLHGCYSCLKAAVVQARFFEKLAAFKADPSKNPEPKLVLLGDYIDRGMFSINGVLRAVLLLFLQAPEHVYVLRGNHEYFLEFQGNVYGGVKPSEAIDTLRPHVDVDVFRNCIRLFEALPAMLLFERTLLVHGGIPRDLTIKQKLTDLASLNDPDVRFQMMWSDPSRADVIPAALQEQSARFPFGRLQAQRFLHKLGCVALIRGHDKITEGFRKEYDDPNLLLCTLFSSGGSDNHDLPVNSSYRQVLPMALTLRLQQGRTQITPWRIAYERFNEPDRNRFFQEEPELKFVG
ncbi:MAG TPA: metallophosphoesterase family protein [Polyangiales bacterium]